MAKRDYYEVLGVSRDADADAIRSAHRRLARELHPDLNKADDAAGRFAEVQEAYDVLSDEEKRKRYDRLGHAGLHSEATGAGGAGPSPWANIDPDQFESIFGDVFGGGFGGGGFGRARRGPMPTRGRDLEHVLTVGFVTAARGGDERIRLTDGDGGSQSIDVRIPKGVESGAKLRLRGKGHPGRHGGDAGDLILQIDVAPQPRLRRDGLDLSIDVPITIAEAALGCEVEVPLLSGSATVRIPAGTGSGARLRLRGKGVEAADGRVGDFHAVVSIAAPAKLDDVDRAALESMRDRLPSPRTASPWNRT